MLNTEYTLKMDKSFFLKCQMSNVKRAFQIITFEELIVVVLIYTFPCKHISRIKAVYTAIDYKNYFL